MNKKTLTIVVVAAVLVVLLLVLEKPFKGKSPKSRPEGQVQLIVPLGEEECSRVELSGFGTSETLVRKGDQWFTHEGYKADPNAVRLLFESLENLGEPELISINPNAFMKFRVDSFLGRRLRMFDTAGKPQVDLVIGQFERDFFHTPVRKSDSSNVYRVPARLASVVRRPNWRNHSILRLDVGSLRRVSVRRSEESYTIERDEATDTWRFSEPTSAPAERRVEMRMAQAWVQQIANLRAVAFEPPTDADMLTTFGLTDAREQLSVALDDGSSYTVIFGNLDPKRKQYYVKRLDDPQVYRIAEYTHTNILKNSADLEPKPKPTPPRIPFPSPTTPAATTGTVDVTTPTKTSTAPSSPPAALEPPPKGGSP